LTFSVAIGQNNERYKGPIIDIHLHAYLLETNHQRVNPVTDKKPVSTTPHEHMLATVEAMTKYNIVLGLVSGPLEAVEKWRKFSPELFIAGAEFNNASEVSIEELRARFADERLGLLGEIGAQYEGLSASDQQFEEYYALAEEYDIPVGIHTGSASPRSTQRHPNFRVRYGNPLLLEDMLVKHPNLCVYMMHGGLPWLTETLAMLHMYPDLYVDIAVKNWIIPREKFHPYLKAVIDAGYGKRIMFGSDQMFWPEAIGLAIEGIESAECLTLEQKADIFYNNAARFLGLSEEEILKHHDH
jgi:predicted TIM-barrel fold metal-dependent hydrolase